MRYFTFLVTYCCLLLGMAAPVLAQTGPASTSARLTWEGYHQVAGSDRKLHKVPAFAEAQYQAGSLFGTYVLNVPGAVAEGQLRNAQYEPFSPADARLLAGATPPAPAPEIFIRTERGQPLSIITVPAVRRGSAGQLEKLISFEYSYVAAPSSIVRRGQQRTYAPHSVLSTGTWYKIGVDKSGVYKLDKAALQALMGNNAAGIDPNRLQIYGNAMGMLPQPNSTWRPDDLVENATYFSGNADATLQDNEYWLFYARGPHVWERDPTPGTQRFRHIEHLYTDTAYYFVTVAAPPKVGRRIATAPAAGVSNSPTITRFAERWFYERDLDNLAKSGRQWLGESFSLNGRLKDDLVADNMTDLVPGTPLQLTASLAADASGPNSFRILLNGTPVITQAIVQVNSASDSEYANTSLQTYSVAVPSSSAALRLNLIFTGTDVSDKGYLDYLEVNALKQLRFSGSALEFRSFENIRPGAVSQFTVANGTGNLVWEVTNPRRPRAYTVDGTGSFTAPTDSLREFVMVNPNGSFATPRSFGRVANQDLHAINAARNLDLVIVTYPAFKRQADDLAAWRTTHDGLKVAVVTTDQVYNEFGSGGQDITAIRDLMKMVYDQRDNPSRQQYLLLFGDASYDYKSDPSNDASKLPSWWLDRTTRDANAQNFVPTYQSRESFSVIYGRQGGFGQQTYCSDDYFGQLDDDEGEWDEYSPIGEIMDIGVGRLPVRMPKNQLPTAQATLVVNKLISYASQPAQGKWRNRLTFVADDEDGSAYIRNSAEPQVRRIQQRHPEYNIRKVYLDMYPQVTTSGEQSPECAKALDEAIEQGSLVVNYNGHGGPAGWTQEQILTNASVLRLQNRNKLTFMVTGTCDFSAYDNPLKDSAGEQALTDTESAAIGLFTTSRKVFDITSAQLIEAFYDTALTFANGNIPRLGEATRYSKRKGASNPLNRNFVLLGDPSMKLARPELAMTLDSINGRVISTTATDTLKALAKVRLSGSVRNGSSISAGINTGFSGVAQVTVYDKPTIVKTLASNPTKDSVLNIPVQESIIYDGQATVTNGRFTVQFVVPRDINYNTGLGKVSLYARNPTPNALIDAHGYRGVPVGDAVPITNANRDTIPPRIRLAMDNLSFVYGGLTGTNTTLIGRLFDESGINTAGAGIGHEITATLDNNPAKLTILNDFYTAKADSFQSGEVRYSFKDLSPGPHVLHLKAWDNFNNSSVRDVEFIAAKTDKLALEHVLNYPNPFATHTTFHFDHNRNTEELDVQVQIFTVSGRLVRTLRATFPAGTSHIPHSSSDTSLSWNGRDEFNDPLARGVYVYRVSVRSLKDESTASKFEKLVILN